MSSFEEYFTSSQQQKETADSLIGILRVIQLNRKTAFVSVKGISTDIFIPNEQLRNRAIHGDLVAIRLLPLTQWQPISKTNEINSAESEMKFISDDDYVRAQDTNQRLWHPREDVISESCKNMTSLKNTALSSAHPIDVESNRLQMQPTGEVISIAEYSRQKSHVGCLSLKCKVEKGKKLPESQKYIIFQPQDSKYPYLRINRNQLPAAFVEKPFEMKNHIFVADIVEHWPISAESAFGENVRSIGEMGSIQAETTALLLENGINHSIFSDDCLKPLQDILGTRVTSSTGHVPWLIPEAEILKRRDLRSYRIFTIDPPTAKDLDDALHITKLSEDLYEIGVHIADVSYFLTPDTALDKEAQHRATSVYLVQKVVPMLPSILCEELCSLNPNVDRLAFSCIWKMHADGTVSSEAPWFGRTVIRCCSKLDYPTAQRMIDGTIPSSPSPGTNPDAFLSDLAEDIWESSRRPVGQSAWECSNDVRMMAAIAKKRRALRLENGALVLTRSKLTFRLDANGNPTESSSYVIRESNNLVEEYMLLANYFVAQELLSKLGPAAFLRSHAPPDVQKLEKLKMLCSLMDIAIDVSSAMSLQRSLVDIAQRDDPLLMQVVTSLLTQPMNPAQYGIMDGLTPEGRRHYALAIPYYTHFTSPIRRYADVMVHRLLALSLEGATVGDISPEKLHQMSLIAGRCNDMKKAAKLAQDRSDRVFLAVYLDKSPAYELGVVIDIGQSSFTVLIPKYGFDVRLFVNNMPDVQCTFDDSSHVLTLRKDKATPSPVSGTLLFDSMEISVMKKVKLLIRAKKTPPIDIETHLVGEL